MSSIQRALDRKKEKRNQSREDMIEDTLSKRDRASEKGRQHSVNKLSNKLNKSGVYSSRKY